MIQKKIQRALVNLPVSQRQMMGAGSTLMQIMICKLWGLPPAITREVWFAGLILTVGASCQGYENILQKKAEHRTGKELASDSERVTGAILLVVAMCFGANRSALLQYLMQQSPNIVALDKISIGSRTMIWSGIMGIGMSITIEGAAQPLSKFTTELFFTLFFIAFVLNVMVLAEYKLLQLTSAVTFQVFALLHSIPIILGGVFFFGEKLHFMDTLGFAFCLLGSFYYSIVVNKQRETDKKKLHELGKDDEENLNTYYLEDDTDEEEIIDNSLPNVFLSRVNKNIESNVEYITNSQSPDDTLSKTGKTSKNTNRERELEGGVTSTALGKGQEDESVDSLQFVEGKKRGRNLNLGKNKPNSKYAQFDDEEENSMEHNRQFQFDPTARTTEGNHRTAEGGGVSNSVVKELDNVAEQEDEIEYQRKNQIL